MRIIFAGTPEFAVPSLAALLNSTHKIIAVYTQPDRPSGRGQKLTASPVKELALQHHIPVFQPKTLRDPEAQEVLKNLHADLMIVVAYGLILPKTVLDTPKYGCINVHGSLLPRWRGAAPIQRSILAGDTETGITTMQMDEGLDTGAMLLKASCPITKTTTTADLQKQLSELGAELLIKTIEQLENGSLKANPQNSAEATHAKKIEKPEAEINWQKSAEEINRMVHAFNPWPIAFTHLKDLQIRIWDATIVNEKTTQTPGTIIQVSKESIDVATSNGILRILQLQLPNHRALPVKDILNSKADLFTINSHFTNPSNG